MGMYDSFLIDCPVCKHELEFQSKSGACMLARYGKKPKKGEYSFVFEKMSADVAMDLLDDVARCQFCNNRIKLDIDIPDIPKVKARSLGKRAEFIYEGNYNPKHPESIRRAKELNKILKSK